MTDSTLYIFKVYIKNVHSDKVYTPESYVYLFQLQKLPIKFPNLISSMN